MKNIAIAFALMPWYCTFIMWLLTPTTYVMFNQTMAMSGTIFLMVTPGLLAVAMLVAYREGQYSERKK
jgi:hypothetical protein